MLNVMRLQAKRYIDLHNEWSGGVSVTVTSSETLII